jgi:tripartite-type tricarboxylate transporter receptor subunit TctC
MPTRRRFLAAALAARPAGGLARAQEGFPDRPVCLVVSFAAGGFNDVLARFLAQGAAPGLGQPVVVENRAGGGGMLGSELVARAAPDGHTLLMASVPHVVSPLMVPGPAYDPVRDFAGVILAGEVPNVLVVHPDVPARSVPELLALIRAHPGRYSYASNSVGGSSHLGMELFRMAAGGLDVTHVPYRGSAPALADLMAGRVAMTMNNLTFQLPAIRDGRLRAIAVASAQRSPLLPEVPTVAESGLPGFRATAWFAVLAPAGTPAPVLARLGDVLAGVLRGPDVAARLPGFGVIAGDGPATMRFLAEEQGRWSPVIRAANIRAG